MQRAEFIVIHHSATEDSGTVSWGAIRNYHTRVNGWREIGYHFGIERVNDQYEILLGRFPYEVGAHCAGLNDKSIGVCVVGNYDADEPSPAMLKKLFGLVAWLQLQYGIADSRIVGHCEFAPKTCPGAHLFEIVKAMKSGLHYR